MGSYENNIIGGIYMITLAVLLAIVIVAAIIAFAWGAGFIFVLGDILIAILIMKLFIKLFIDKNKK